MSVRKDQPSRCRMYTQGAKKTIHKIPANPANAKIVRLKIHRLFHVIRGRNQRNVREDPGVQHEATHVLVKSIAN